MWSKQKNKEQLGETRKENGWSKYFHLEKLRLRFHKFSGRNSDDSCFYGTTKNALNIESHNSRLLPVQDHMQFAFPKRLLLFLKLLKQIENKDLSHFLSEGCFFAPYNNGRQNVMEFFHHLGWSLSYPSFEFCNNKTCNNYFRKSGCDCIVSAIKSLPTPMFYWGALSNTYFALCYCVSCSTDQMYFFNRIPWIGLITNKYQLAQTCVMFSDKDQSHLQEHLPATYIIKPNFPDDKLYHFANELFSLHPIWIIKPTNFAKGEGISISFRENGAIDFVKKVLNSTYKRLGKIIVQSYVTNPMLLDGRKFDLRVYLLFVTTLDGFVCFYHTGYVRLALKTYAQNATKKQHMSSHLTNQAVQAKESDYDSLKETTVWSVEQMNNYLNANSSEFSNNWTTTVLHIQIKHLMTSLVNALVQRMKSTSLKADETLSTKFPCRNTFNLLGIDILIDETGKCWIIEANIDPALSQQTSVLEKLLPCVTNESFALSMEIISRRFCNNKDNLANLTFLRNFTHLSTHRIS